MRPAAAAGGGGRHQEPCDPRGALWCTQYACVLHDGLFLGSVAEGRRPSAGPLPRKQLGEVADGHQCGRRGRGPRRCRAAEGWEGGKEEKEEWETRASQDQRQPRGTRPHALTSARLRAHDSPPSSVRTDTEKPARMMPGCGPRPRAAPRRTQAGGTGVRLQPMLMPGAPAEPRGWAPGPGALCLSCRCRVVGRASSAAGSTCRPGWFCAHRGPGTPAHPGAAAEAASGPPGGCAALCSMPLC